MNVENRKLFSNRDARRKLAEMGGIIASSHELLGAAQTYNGGGDVSVEQYVAIIPGINSGRPVRLTGSTLSRLQRLAPDLMMQAQVFDQATAEAGGVDVMSLRPGDAFVERLIIGDSPVSSVRDVPGYLDTLADTAPTNSARNIDLIRAVNQSAKGAEFADWLNSVGQAGIDAVSEAMTTVAGAGLSADAELGMAMSIAAGYLGFPEKAAQWSKNARDEMAYAQDMLGGDINIFGTPQGDAAFTVPEAGLRMKEAARVQGIIDQAGENSPLLAEGSVSETLPDIPMSIIEARIMAGPEGIMMEGPAQSTAPASSGSNVTMPGSMSIPTMPKMPVMPGVDVSTGVPMTMAEVEQQLLDERIAAADAGLTNTQPMEDRFPAEDLYQAEQQNALDLIRANEMARNERLQMTGFEETAARNAEAAKAERDAEQAAEETPDQPTPPPAGADTTTTSSTVGADIERVATDPNLTPEQRNANTAASVLSAVTGEDASELSIKDRISGYEEIFKEMLGESDEEKASEMWHNMAMIGFAIAAGESPNALQNIANGLLEGTKMMKEDRATRRKREDAITTMAIEAGMGDEKSAREFAQRVALAAAGGGGSGGSRLSPLEPFADQVANLAKSMVDSGQAPDLPTALNMAAEAYRPYYEMSAGGDAVPGGRTPTTHKEANDAAKAAGQTTYTFAGETFQVQ